jgi:prepilin-type N-terminal cleavage/methylation domain-containing protein
MQRAKSCAKPQNPLLAGLAQKFPLGDFGGWSYCVIAMRIPSARRMLTGFTLVEVLVVLVILAILALLMLPSVVDRPTKSYQVVCMNNQRQIALGLIMWENDNDGKYPWQSLVASNGTKELVTEGHPSVQFKATSGYLKYPKVYLCPTDKSKIAATHFAAFTDHNVSYFVNFDVETNYSATVLTGDRHLEDHGKPVTPGLFNYSKSSVMNWTRELHNSSRSEPVGVLAFADGHAERVFGKNLEMIFQRQGSITNRLAVP